MSATACTVSGESESVAQARRWVGDVVRTAGFEDRLVEDAVLAASELVTNAVRHTASGAPEGRVRIEVLIGVHRVRVSVVDAGSATSAPTVPCSCPDPGLAEASRGLYLVDRWAERLVVQGGPKGRTVAADFACDGAVGRAGSVALPKRRRAGSDGEGQRRFV